MNFVINLSILIKLELFLFFYSKEYDEINLKLTY